MPTSRRADLSKVLPAVRCTARRQDGQPCKRYAARGANVCLVHGGSAPQVKAAAKRRLDQASDLLVQQLLSMALDGDVADNVALQAIIAALDRAGFSVRQAMDIQVGPAPWELLMEGLTVAPITKAQHDALVAGLPAPAELPQRQPDPYYDTPEVLPRPTFAEDNVIEAEVVELQTMEEANAEVAAVNRAAGVWPTPKARRKRR